MGKKSKKAHKAKAPPATSPGAPSPEAASPAPTPTPASAPPYTPTAPLIHWAPATASSPPITIYKQSLPLGLFQSANSRALRMYEPAHAVFRGLAAEVLPEWVPTTWTEVEGRVKAGSRTRTGVRRPTKEEGQEGVVRWYRRLGDVGVVMPLRVQGPGSAWIDCEALEGIECEVKEGHVVLLPAFCLPPDAFGTPAQPRKTICRDGRAVEALMTYWTPGPGVREEQEQEQPEGEEEGGDDRDKARGKEMEEREEQHTGVGEASEASEALV